VSALVARGDTEQVWEWPDSLDALIAAPEHHSLVFENDAVRVLDTRIRPGETVPLHTHRWPATLYVLGSDHFVRRDAEGHVLLDTRAADALSEPGTNLSTGPLPPHTLENVGESEIRVLNIELKRP
jgi:quercetin dioxygenase-like cupin family protein